MSCLFLFWDTVDWSLLAPRFICLLPDTSFMLCCCILYKRNSGTATRCTNQRWPGPIIPKRELDIELGELVLAVLNSNWPANLRDFPAE